MTVGSFLCLRLFLRQCVLWCDQHVSVWLKTQDLADVHALSSLHHYNTELGPSAAFLGSQFNVAKPVMSSLVTGVGRPAELHDSPPQHQIHCPLRLRPAETGRSLTHGGCMSLQTRLHPASPAQHAKSTMQARAETRLDLVLGMAIETEQRDLHL